MTMSQRIGWRSYVSPLSSLLTSIYGVWNAETTSTTLATSVYSAWNGEIKYTSLDNGVVSVYNAENNANDSKGTNHATLVNGATFSASGKVGSSFYCDGIDDYVQFPNNSLNLTGDFSISMWVQVNYISTWSNYIYPIHNLTADASGNYYGYRLYLNGNSYVFDIGNGTATLDRILFNCGSDPQSQIAPSIGDNWKHIVITRKSGQVTKMYIGGNPITAEPTSPASNTNLKGQNTSTLDPAYLTTHTPYLGKWSNAVTKVDGLTFWNRVLTYTEISKLYNYDMSTSYYANGTTYYYKGNGLQYPFSAQSFPSTDDSVSTNHGTSPSGSTPTLTTGLIGNAFLFDGVNDYIQLPDNSLNLTGPFSYSFWVKSTDTTGYTVILGNIQGARAPYGFAHGYQVWLQYGKIIPGFRDGADSTNYSATSVATVANGSWNHVVITYNYTIGNSNGGKIYINGTLDSSFTVPNSTNFYSSPMKACIGARNQAGTPEYFLSNGTNLDAVTSWQKELSVDEITQLYNMGGGIQYPFTTQTIKTPYAVYNGDNLIDPIGARNATVVGGVTYTAGKVGNAYTFNGSTGYLTLPANSMRFTGSLSISMWIYPTVYPTIAQGTIGLISNPSLGYGDGYDISFYNNGSNVISLYSRFGTANGNATFPIQLQVTSPPLNTWTLVTITFEAGVGAKTYYNGVLQGSVSSSITTLLYTNMPTTYTPTIGYGSNATGPFVGGKFAGQIDGLTFWNSALTAPEVITLFNDGVGMEYPYSSTLPAKLPSYGDVVSTNHGTSPATAAPTFTTGKFGKAFRFDGVNDHILLPSTALKFTGDFSVSLWVYIPTNSATSQSLISCRRIPSISTGWEMRVGSNTIYFGFGAANGFKSTSYSNNSNIGSWKHVVATRKNGTGGKLYIDGILQGTISAVEPISYDSVDTPSIGAMKYAPNTTWYVQNGTKMDAISTWTKELTATEITDLYNSGTGKQYPNY